MSEYVKVSDKGGDFSDKLTWKPDEAPEFEGVMLNREDNIGTYNQTVFTFKGLDGKEYSVWAPTVLKKFLGDIDFGSKVKIVYKGKKKTKNGMGTYKDFDVFVAVDNASSNTKDSSEKEEIPF